MRNIRKGKKIDCDIQKEEFKLEESSKSLIDELLDADKAIKEEKDVLFEMKSIENLKEKEEAEKEHEYVQSLCAEITEEMEKENIEEELKEEDLDESLKKEIEKIEEEALENVKPTRKSRSLKSRRRKNTIIEEIEEEEEEEQEEVKIEETEENKAEQPALIIMLLVSFITVIVIAGSIVINLKKEKNITYKIKEVIEKIK